ncbi:MAG: 4Fe-4S binding protein [Dehalococcoidia bacterium]|nr:4Fe-4S binding protein [Dehalococcoidia bacterium]
MVIDLDRCTNCQTCTVTCKVEPIRGGPAGPPLRFCGTCLAAKP